MWILPGVMTFGYTTAGGAQDIQIGSGEVVDNQWHHLVGTFDGDKLVSYVDGIPLKQSMAEQKPATCNAPVKIGVQPPATGGPITGTVDEVAIFSRGLTESEVLEVMEGLELMFFSVDYRSKITDTWGRIKKSR